MSAFSLQRILSVLLASALGCCSLCAEEGTDKLSPAEIEKLAGLRLDYDLAREQIQQKQWVEPMEKLRSGYREGMQKVQERFSQVGDLTKALTARTAIKIDPDPFALVTQVPEIADVQSIFLDTQTKIREQLNQSFTQLASFHVSQLAAINNQMTKDKRLDSALIVEHVIKKIVAELSLQTIDEPSKPYLESDRTQVRLTELEVEKLDALIFSYDLAREDIKQKQWVQPMKKLRIGYRDKMKGIQDKFAEARNLTKALGARSAAKNDPTVTTIDPKITEVAVAQRAFINEQKNIQKRMDRTLAKLLRSHVAQLSIIQDKLTKSGRLDAALVVQDKIRLLDFVPWENAEKASGKRIQYLGKISVFKFSDNDGRDFRSYNIKDENIKKYIEPNGESYLGPSRNGIDAELVFKFPKPLNFAQAYLKTGCRLWDFTKEGGGRGRGMSNIEGSADGKKWIVLLDGMSAEEWGRKDFNFEGSLPRDILTGRHLYIRIRLFTEGVPGRSVYTVAQFGRINEKEKDGSPFFELTFLE